MKIAPAITMLAAALVLGSSCVSESIDEPGDEFRSSGEWDDFLLYDVCGGDERCFRAESAANPDPIHTGESWPSHYPTALDWWGGPSQAPVDICCNSVGICWEMPANNVCPGGTVSTPCNEGTSWDDSVTCWDFTSE